MQGFKKLNTVRKKQNLHHFITLFQGSKIHKNCNGKIPKKKTLKM